MRAFHLSIMYLVSIITLSSSNNICSKFRTQSKYVNLGESGKLKILSEKENEAKPICGMELITCPFCQLELSIEHSPSLDLCYNFFYNKTNDDCPCGKIFIEDLGKRSFSCLQTGFLYKSSARTLIFSYIFNQNEQSLNDSISIIYKSQKNQQFIKGEFGNNGIIESPNFPSDYNMDFDTEYILSCVSGDDCRISLIFTDFSLSPLSVMEFFDSDGRLIQFVSGSKIRPPYMVSTSFAMFIRFSSNGGSSFRYRAKYNFTSTLFVDNINTDCGGELMGLGGNMYMNNVTGLYDCFWIIKPLISLSFLKTHIYLKILAFEGDGELVVRNGDTSYSEILETIHNNASEREYITNLSKGLYVSYNGIFSNNSKIIFSYAAFSLTNCLPIDYACHNKRCIQYTLTCDSIDHCGDNSDEDINCKGSTTPNVIHKFWWPVRNMDRDTDFRLTIGLWICALMFVGTLAFLIIGFCRKPNTDSAVNNDLIIANEQIQTIAQLIDMGDTGEYDAPPVYEPPPDYNQALKFSYQKLESNGSICDGENTSVSCFDYQGLTSGS